MNDLQQEAFDLARKRIAEAKESGASALCLSPRRTFSFDGKRYLGDERLAQLADIPPEISGLSELLALTLWETQVTDIAHLSGLTMLQLLHLDETPVSDLVPISRLANLQSLGVTHTQVSDISPVTNLAALRFLSIRSTKITDLAPVEKTTSLRSLDLGNTQISTIEPLVGHTGLQALNLHGTDVTDIKPINNLFELQELDLSATDIIEIAPLFGLSSLKRLDISHTQIADISLIATLTGLQDFRFNDTPACTVDPTLQELSKIRDNAERTRLTFAHLIEEEPDATGARTDEDAVTEDDAPDYIFTREQMDILQQEGSEGKSERPTTILDPIETSGAKSGPTSEQVLAIQRGLGGAGFDPGPIDGLMGSRTEQALKAALDQAGTSGTGDLWLDFKALRDFLEENKTPPFHPRPDETAPFHSDQPATQDLLNRRAVAETLGTIVDEVWRDARAQDAAGDHNPGAPDHDRTFIVHLHGRWGSGKTSILNFVREVLLSGKIAKQEPKDAHLGRAPDPPWVVVDYNAWRNQNLGPAWWTLMDTVYREAKRQLRWTEPGWLSLCWGHLRWRLITGWLPILAGFLISATAVYVVIAIDPVKDWGFSSGWGDLIKAASGLIGLLGTLLVLRSETGILNTRTAKRYMELSRDPMTPLISRYSALIEDIGRPVAVFIDDLDRCDAEFVVELLQNIQTMFRSAPVLYVVAADRGWICTSYEQVYAPYCEPIAEPGHSLGNMFLEKIFQLSVEVPGLAGAQREAFWDHLVKAGETPDAPEERAAAEAEVTEKLEKATTEQQVIEIVEEEAKHGPERAAIAGARAFHRMQSKELVAEREHFLMQYADLLEANPRAMKRLLNAYGFRRGFDIQSSNRSDADALVRWTILENRWPILADNLAQRSTGPIDAAAMEALMRSAEVREVANGLTFEQLSTIAGAPVRR
jgi:hypothetical protein